MQCYTELLPPTAVSHAVALPFTGPNANNIVIAKTSLLQVLEVKRSSDAVAKLVLIGEYPIAGTVTDIASVKSLDTQSGGEALLVASKDAKLSLVEWDAENHQIHTISIHFYEGENIITQPFGPALADVRSILTVDPSSRCAALKFGARQLAILPFRQFGEELIGDEEDAFDGEHRRELSSNRTVNGASEQTPYKASFVLPLTTLDPSLSHTVHLAFLYEYREPTFGTLSSPSSVSDALLAERKDILQYSVYTLDLEQRASTNLITVPNLPSTLWKVVPLRLPIGGALLVGTNEFVHVDQSGKTNAIAVNEFAKSESAFGMADQSYLHMKLEDCQIEFLDPKSGDLLVVLRDGSLAILNFQMSGRSIGGLNVTRISSENGGSMIQTTPSCVTKVQNDGIFIGSEDGPASLVRWISTSTVVGRKRSHAQMVDQEASADEEEAEDDDDDLYEAAPDAKKRAMSTTPSSDGPTSYQFARQDSIPSLGPVNNVCLGRSKGKRRDKLSLLAGTGRGGAGLLALLSRDIIPKAVRRTHLPNTKRVWAICTGPMDQQKSETESLDNMLFAYDGQSSKVYDMTERADDRNPLRERNAPEFEKDGETLDIGTLAGNTRVVQCRRHEVRTYEPNLALSQIIPMLDDETDVEYSINHTSLLDPYLLLVRDDNSVMVLQVQGKDIEPLDGQGSIAEKKWRSGCVYAGELTGHEPGLFLLSTEGTLHAFSLPDLEQIYAAPALALLPPLLVAGSIQRRIGIREILVELLVADVGYGDMKQPYLMVRTAMDDIILYEPFHHPIDPAGSWHTNLRFRKVSNTYAPRSNDSLVAEQDVPSTTLKVINMDGYSVVRVSETPPSLLLKPSSSLPRILEIRGLTESSKTLTLSSLNRRGCEGGFVLVQADGEVVECQLPQNAWYDAGWAVRQVELDGAGEVRHIAYHEERGIFILSTRHNVDFHFAEDDVRHQDHDDITLRPQIARCAIHLVSSATHQILYSLDMPYQDTVTALKVMQLEVSENTHELKSVVVVSTAAQRGEDMPAKGGVTVFDMIDVVPEPDRPESGVKLHVLSREETKGAVTALDGFPGGLIGTAQGQKIIIRGLKEDGSCLPVAFLDTQCHNTTLKSFSNRGLWLLGDAWKGLWLGGFTEEPYKLTVLGKSRTHMEVIAADFLPFDDQLYILIMDADMDLHVLQYDPENPKTVSGMRLLHRSTFHVGHFPTSMTLLLSSSDLNLPTDQSQNMTNGDHSMSSSEIGSPPPNFQILTTTQTGSLGLITALDEATYRRLSALQTHLTSMLEHAAGLNPRAYRAVESEGFGARGVVDGSLVRRINELGATRRADVLSRAGSDAWTLRSDLEIIAGGGLTYL